MTTLIAVASRLFAIYLVLTAIGYVSYVPFAFDLAGSSITILVVAVIGVVLPVVVATFLWFKPLAVSRALIPAEAPELKSSEISETALFSVLVVILGLYLTVTAGASLVGILVEFMILKSATISVQGPSITGWSPLMASALELILGLVLLLRLNGLKGIYFKLKHGGLGHEAKSE